MTLATPEDAMREYANVVGEDHPDRAWLLTDYYVWVRNPHYRGPPAPHPDDCRDDEAPSAFD